MQRWTVGEVEIVRVADESFALPTDERVPDWMIPELAPTATEMGLGFSAVAIAAGDRRIVVDPWLANDGVRSRSDADARIQGLLDELEEADFPASAIDTVVDTHIDGIGWNTRPGPPGEPWRPTFPEARYLYTRAEIDAFRRDPDGPVFGGQVRDLELLDAAGQLETFDPPRQLCPEVSLHDAPGHSFGQVQVRIESGGDLAVVPGHLFLTPLSIDRPERSEIDGDPLVATATRRRLLDELAERRGLLVATLFAEPGGGRVERHGDGFRLSFN